MGQNHQLTTTKTQSILVFHKYPSPKTHQPSFSRGQNCLHKENSSQHMACTNQRLSHQNHTELGPTRPSQLGPNPKPTNRVDTWPAAVQRRDSAELQTDSVHKNASLNPKIKPQNGWVKLTVALNGRLGSSGRPSWSPTSDKKFRRSSTRQAAGSSGTISRERKQKGFWFGF